MARLSLEQRQAVAWAINCYGVPGTRATPGNLETFERRFVGKCLRDALQCGRQGKFMVSEQLLQRGLAFFEDNSSP